MPRQTALTVLAAALDHAAALAVAVVVAADDGDWLGGLGRSKLTTTPSTAAASSRPVSAAAHRQGNQRKRQATHLVCDAL
ncbi:hypothetical protein BC831DRAFT_483869 [Entophlyctis helioformis]|nr:hypothetical protein BC831DRAFT_483869 [Entophlyctis helioformis]